MKRIKRGKLNPLFDASVPSPKFHQFLDLNDDLMMNVLSFVAEIPFEIHNVNAPHSSTVTGVFPLVCKKFNQFCQSDFFWQLCLERMRLRDTYLWGAGILRLLPRGTAPGDDPLEQVRTLFQLDYKSIYRRVVATHIRFTGPVFYMTGSVKLGHTLNLHFFEPRYRHLISMVMQGWPESARHGEPICANEQGEWPTFVYAHRFPLAPTTPACLVQVKQCLIYQDGTADVRLLVHAYVWLERIWERPNSGRLFEASCIRMGRDMSRTMDNQTTQRRSHSSVSVMVYNYNDDDE